MKRHYDQKTEVRDFSPGDQVVALLPIPGSPFGAKYSGPYTVRLKVSENNYVVATPERRRSTQLCHVNLLKPYFLSQLDQLPGLEDAQLGKTVVDPSLGLLGLLEVSPGNRPGLRQAIPHLFHMVHQGAMWGGLALPSVLGKVEESSQFPAI
ncbi:hypothetical protein N1851_025818 [Merluccius polli]|uniref:Integrase p58-like C-terminal domain-containing protein n=1 Tax=Merluccius polli TaxID=89951 RepID=A0AA47MD77_MERPO|nr:hypothetical protein N1851_025818 [Merluccius polli]